jgi:hypothetical protein
VYFTGIHVAALQSQPDKVGPVNASRTPMSRCFTLLAAIIVVAAGCSSRHITTSIPPSDNSNNREYIDLQAGWRLRAIIPMGTSGDYKLKFKESSTSAFTVELAEGEFKGYELSYYTIEARTGGGVRIHFSSAELMKDGKSFPLVRSVRPLFAHPGRARFVRLVYLTRVSEADHDMAVIASESAEGLDTWTKTVQKNESGRCGAQSGGRCTFIPAGIAVRPEKLRASDGVWVPAR